MFNNGNISFRSLTSPAFHIKNNRKRTKGRKVQQTFDKETGKVKFIRHN